MSEIRLWHVQGVFCMCVCMCTYRSFHSCMQHHPIVHMHIYKMSPDIQLSWFLGLCFRGYPWVGPPPDPTPGSGWLNVYLFFFWRLRGTELKWILPIADVSLNVCWFLRGGSRQKLKVMFFHIFACLFICLCICSVAFLFNILWRRAAFIRFLRSIHMEQRRCGAHHFVSSSFERSFKV